MNRSIQTILLIALLATGLSTTSMADQEIPAGPVTLSNAEMCSHLPTGASIRFKVDPGSTLAGMSYAGSNGYIRGKLQTCDDGVLIFWPENSSGMVQVPVADMQSLAFSDGKSGNAMNGAGIGLVVGLVSGIITNQQRKELTGSGGDFFEPEASTMTVGSAVMGGILTGALIGALIRTDKWNTVWDGKTVITAVDYRPGEYQLAVGLSF